MISPSYGAALWRDAAPPLDRAHAGHGGRVGLPSDPEFRSAFGRYLEWGTRLAVINSAGRRNGPTRGRAHAAYGVGACRADRIKAEIRRCRAACLSGPAYSSGPIPKAQNRWPKPARFRTLF